MNIGGLLIHQIQLRRVKVLPSSEMTEEELVLLTLDSALLLVSEKEMFPAANIITRAFHAMERDLEIVSLLGILMPFFLIEILSLQ